MAKLTLDRIEQAQIKKSEKKHFKMELDGEMVDIEVIQKFTPVLLSFILRRFSEYVVEFDEAGEDAHEAFFTLALLEAATDIEFNQYDLSANVYLLENLVELEMLGQIMDLIPEKEIKRVLDFISLTKDRLDKITKV